MFSMRMSTDNKLIMKSSKFKTFYRRQQHRLGGEKHGEKFCSRLFCLIPHSRNGRRLATGLDMLDVPTTIPTNFVRFSMEREEREQKTRSVCHGRWSWEIHSVELEMLLGTTLRSLHASTIDEKDFSSEKPSPHGNSSHNASRIT